MRITFVISSLSSGGAERVMSLLANYWSSKGKSVTLITYAQKGPDFYSLNSNIDRIRFSHPTTSKGILDSLAGNLKRVRVLRSAFIESKPDVIISFMDTVNVLTIIARWGLKIPLIISERIDPRFHSTKLFWRILRKALYRKASALVIQTKNILKWAYSTAGKHKVHIIPNPVLTSTTSEDLVTYQKPYILGVGRLEHQKGFDLLIEAFAKVYSDFPDWKLVIAGEGSQRESLTQLIDRHELKNVVQLPGNLSNTFPVMSHASLFVLSSRFEGFPNVILESMALGKPVISFDCPSGPAEIIEDMANGVLVRDISIDGLEKSLRLLMSNEDLRNKLGSRAKEVLHTYSLEKIVSDWEALFIKLGVKV